MLSSLSISSSNYALRAQNHVRIIHVALLLHDAGLVIEIQPFHDQLHHDIWMTKNISAKALVIASAGMSQPCQLTYHLRYLRPGIDLMQIVQDITDFIDHAGPVGLFGVR
jgi:hypothetical protein